MTRIDIGLAQHMATDLNALARIQPDDIFENVYTYLESCDRSLGTYGVETIPHPADGKPALMYCNVGDPYMATLIFDAAERTFRVACWGDIVEERCY